MSGWERLIGTGQEGTFWRLENVLYCDRVVGFTRIYMLAFATFQYI